MAIGFGSSATGVKSATTGTSFTITLTVPAGNFIIVSVLSSSTTNNVTSITDVGGNVYSFKSSNNMASFTNEIWVTKSNCLASGGTITVNVTTGFLAIGIAAYYSGVEAADVPVAAGGSASPITTGSITLRDASSWLFMGGGEAAANAFTAQNGSLRNQTTVTGFSALIIDSNGAASPVTLSATMTAASWGLIRIFLRTGTLAPGFAAGDTQDLPNIPHLWYTDAEPLTFVQLKRVTPVPIVTPPAQSFAARGYATDEEDINPGPKAPAYVTAAALTQPYASVYSVRDYAVAGEDVNPGFIATIPSKSGWDSTDSADYIQKVVPLAFAEPDIVAPVRPQPAVAPPSTAAWQSTDSADYIQKIVPLDYALPDFVSPVRLPTVIPSPSMAGWSPQSAAFSPFNDYAYAEEDINPGALTTIVPPMTWLHQPQGYNFRGYAYAEEDTNIGALATVIPPMSSWSIEIGRKANPQQYAPPTWTAPEKVTPTLVASIAGWFGTDGQKSIPPRYAPSDDLTKPAFVSLLPSIAGWFGTTGQNALLQRYTTPAFDAPFIIPPVSFVSGWLGTDGQKSVVLSYQKIQDSPLHGAISIPLLPTIAGWFNTDGQKSVLLRYAPSDYVSQYYPTLAQLPKLSQLAEPGVNAQPQKFAIPTWDAPPKFGLIVAAPLTIAGWLSTDGRPAVVLEYAPSDYVNQASPTLATLPILRMLAELPNQRVENRYALPDFVSQLFPTLVTTPLGYMPYLAAASRRTKYIQSIEDVNPGAPFPVTPIPWLPDVIAKNALIQQYALSALNAPDRVVAPPVVLSWIGTDGQKSMVLRYAPSDDITRAQFIAPQIFVSGWSADVGRNALPQRFAPTDIVNQIFPTLSLLPRLSGLAEPGINAQPQRFAAPTWEAPPKFGLIVAAPLTIAGWLGTDGANAVRLGYAPSDYVNQISPTLATLPALRTLAELPNQRVENKYAVPDFVSQLFPTLVSVSTGYFPYIAATSGRSKYAQSIEDVNPGAPFPVTPISWSVDIGRNALLQRFAPSDDITRPPFIAPVSVLGWQSFIAQNAFLQRFAPSDDLTRPPFIAPISVSGWQSFVAQNALLQKFAPSDDLIRALSVVPVPSAITISSWTGTMGQNAVQYRFAQPDFVNQIYPTLALLPRLLSDIAFLPPNALPQKYAAPTWDAPPKFGLIVAAPLTISGWTGTMGQNAVVLRYALPDFINQIRPTLAALPYLTSELTKPADPIVLLRYAATAYDAPAKYVIVPAPSISGWFGTDGQRAVQLVYAPPDFVTQYSPTRVQTPLGYIQYEGNRQVQLKYAPGDFITQYSPTLVLVSLGYLQYPGNPQVQLRYAPTDFITRIQVPPPVSFAVDFGPKDRPANPPTFAPGDIFKIPDKIFPFVAYPTINSWTPTIGQQSVKYRFAPSDYVTQIRPTLATLPASASFLDFIPPHAQPQKFATPEWFVNQFKPTLARLPLILEGLAFIPPHAQPQHFAVPDFTAPAKFGIIIPPTVIIDKGVIFYKIIAGPMIVDKQINKNVIVYKVYAMSTNLQQKLIRTIGVNKNTGQVLFVHDLDP